MFIWIQEMIFAEKYVNLNLFTTFKMLKMQIFSLDIQKYKVNSNQFWMIQNDVDCLKEIFWFNLKN